MQTILGGGGAIGVPLAQSLGAMGHTVRIVSRSPKAVNKGDLLFPADLTNPAEVHRAIQGSSVVYVTVGFPYRAKIWEACWPPFLENVLASCAAHGSKLVYFDNMYLYDPDCLAHMTEETPIRPTTRKGRVRAALVALIQEAMAAGKVEALIARAADFYGPGIRNSALLELVHKNLAKGKAAQWLISADCKHDFTFTPDAGKAAALLGNTADAYGQTWHVPTANAGLTGRDWVGLFAGKMNKPARITVLPRIALKALGIFVPMLAEIEEMSYQSDRDYGFDSSKFEKRFGVKPTPPEIGVAETIAAPSA